MDTEIPDAAHSGGVVVNGDVEVCPVHDDAGLEALSAAARQRLATGQAKLGPGCHPVSAMPSP
jgi:hypothetical protein